MSIVRQGLSSVDLKTQKTATQNIFVSDTGQVVTFIELNVICKNARHQLQATIIQAPQAKLENSSLTESYCIFLYLQALAKDDKFIKVDQRLALVIHIVRHVSII